MGKVLAFGDSWGYGWENEIPSETNFVKYFAELHDLDYENHCQCGNSLPVIFYRMLNFVESIQEDDLILVTIPPDIRWYRYINREYETLSLDKQADTKLFYKTHDDLFFKDNHLLYIIAIQKILENKKYMMMINFGLLDKEHRGYTAIDYSRIMYNGDQSLTQKLSMAKQPIFDSYNPTRDGPRNENFFGPYFEGNETHPNELGHRQIAELITEFFIDNDEL